MIDNQRIGDDQIHRRQIIQLALPHAVADNLAAAEFDFIAVNGEVFFDFQNQVAVAKAHLIARGWAEHVGVCLSADLAHTPSSKAPITA